MNFNSHFKIFVDFLSTDLMNNHCGFLNDKASYQVLSYVRGETETYQFVSCC